MLVRIISNWKKPDLLRQTPSSTGIWAGNTFTFEETKKFDILIVLNELRNPLNILNPSSNVWSLVQEPYIPSVFDWIDTGHSQYHKVFTHHVPYTNRRYIRSHPAVPWHVDFSYDELRKIPPRPKAYSISCIASTLSSFPGHKARLQFVNYLRNSRLRCDYFGRGLNFIENKWDALYPYKYSIAIENSNTEDYWTEKIADCFLSYTVPIYYGCANIEDYFPSEAIVRIDIHKPEEALRIIRETLLQDHWSDRLSALKEARELVLEKYQFFPHISELIDKYYEDNPSIINKLQPYKPRPRIIRAALKLLNSMS